MRYRLDDYMDADVAYLMGLVVARGTIYETHGVRQLTIQFPLSALEAQGINLHFDQQTHIQLGLIGIQERLKELLDTDVDMNRKEQSIDLIIRFKRNNMIWRNILLLLDEATSFPYFRVPPIFFDPDLPQDWKREFLRGYGDVAGNIRHSNRYVDGHHRVRLDVLNYLTNWEIPVQLCTLLQEHVGIPVQVITWGHPNMNRDFREHQLNVFAQHYVHVGFSFEHKQKILEEFAQWDEANLRGLTDDFCPGVRRVNKRKPHEPGEDNAERLDPRLLDKHFDSYWQICKALGCRRKPTTNQPSLDLDVEQDTTT